MKRLWILCFVLVASQAGAQEGKKPPVIKLDTEIVVRSPLRDIVDDGKPLVLESGDKGRLGQFLAGVEEGLDTILRTEERHGRMIDKNGELIRGLDTRVTSLEKKADSLEVAQAAVGEGLKMADTKITGLETKVTSLEGRVVEITNWANTVWNQAQAVLGQSQQTLAAARAAEEAARPRGLEKLISWIPGLGH